MVGKYQYVDFVVNSVHVGRRYVVELSFVLHNDVLVMSHTHCLPEIGKHALTTELSTL